MTRPMTGPPECVCGQCSTHVCLEYPHWCAHCPVHGADAHDAAPKRLTDAECAAEYWRAESDHCLASEGYDIDWFSGDLLRDEDIACDVHATWHRFATRPHVLEEA